MKALKLTLNQWQRINVEIAKHHPKSVWLVRTKMRKVLGFTPREHREFVPKMSGGHYETMIHLDFYDESQQTMFLLKYSDFIDVNKDYA